MDPLRWVSPRSGGWMNFWFATLVNCGEKFQNDQTRVIFRSTRCLCRAMGGR